MSPVPISRQVISVSEPPKKHLPGKRISTDVDVKQAVTFHLYSLDNSLSYVGKKFRCHAEANGSQLWMRRSLTHTYHASRIKVRGTGVLVTLFLHLACDRVLCLTLTFQSVLVTWCTTSLTFNNCTLCPHCIYVFSIYLRTSSDLCHLQHKLIGFYNRDEKCLLRGTNWVFK